MILRRTWLYVSSGIGIVVVVVGLIVQFFPRSTEEIVVFGVDTASEASSGGIMVDISGAVNRPGVYSFHYGDRIVDALDKAGGFSGEADLVWVDKNLNKSEKLKDGIKLYIRSKSDLRQTSNLVQGSPEIDINTADIHALETLQGVGAATAEKIISARPYARIEELVERKVVSKSVFERIRALIRI